MDKYDTVKEFREHNRALVEEIKDSVKNKKYAKHVFLSRKYRHYHIAYCLLRSTTYERIESKVREGNEPDWGIVNEIVSQNEHLKHVPREKQASAASAAQ